MKKCSHTFWLALSPQQNATDIVVSDRVRHLLQQIPRHDAKNLQFLVLLGSKTKSVVLRELFGVRRAGRRDVTHGLGEIHLHLDPSSVFREEPLLIAEGDLSAQRPATIPTGLCHELARRPIQRPRPEADLTRTASDLYAQLLPQLANIFCLFSEDLGGFEQVAHHLVAWLDHGHEWAISADTRPRVVVVIQRRPAGVKNERQARAHLLRLVRQKTKKKILDYFTAIEIIALFPSGVLSTDTRHRLLKERLMNELDQSRQHRIDTQFLFSAAHLAAFLECAVDHFANAPDKPFNLIRASRMHNPVADNLEQHISTFLTHVKTPKELTEFAAPVIASSFVMDHYPPGAPSFPPSRIFHVLYEDVFSKVSANRVLSFEQSRDVVLRSGFIAKVKTQFEKFASASSREALPSAAVHRANICHFKDLWRGIKSNNTCLSCLRREPQFALDCGHAICENCVVVFGEPDVDDPWVYKVTKCFLCQVVMSKDVDIRIYPPTAGAGVLCVDGGGIRGVAALRFMEKIHARVGLPIPFQRFIKVAVGVSSGGLIVADVFLNGTSVEHATEKFKALASIIFQRRNVVNASFLPCFIRRSVAYFANTIPPFPVLLRGIEFLLSYFADGLYPPHHIEKALKEVFGAERGILDWSYATSTGTRVGLPVATIDAKPSCRLFTNYNGVGERKRGQDHVVKAKDGHGKALLWEIARAASAAPGFFPPKHVGGVGTFQDAGPLENNPLVSTLSEVAALFPLAEEPDFVVSLGTGEPELGSDLPADTAASRNVWKNGAFPRLCRLFWEKMRDRKVSEAFQAYPRYHRLNVRFEGDEPRLDDLQSISYMESKVEQDNTLSHKIDAIARCFVASLFYFELDGIPERLGGRYIGTGYVACSLRHGDPAFRVLFDQLANQSARLFVDGKSIATVDDACLGSDGNFRVRVELSTEGRFAISLQQDASEPCSISGSPFLVERLIVQQSLSAVFGRPDHRKRKMAECLEPAKKRRKLRQ